jgi:hypothetical protein
MEVRDASQVEEIGDGGDISEPDEGEFCPLITLLLLEERDWLIRM